MFVCSFVTNSFVTRFSKKRKQKEKPSFASTKLINQWREIRTRTKRRTSSDEEDPLSSESSLLESVWAWEKIEESEGGILNLTTRGQTIYRSLTFQNVTCNDLMSYGSVTIFFVLGNPPFKLVKAFLRLRSKNFLRNKDKNWNQLFSITWLAWDLLAARRTTTTHPPWPYVPGWRLWMIAPLKLLAVVFPYVVATKSGTCWIDLKCRCFAAVIINLSLDWQVASWNYTPTWIRKVPTDVNFPIAIAQWRVRQRWPWIRSARVDSAPILRFSFGPGVKILWKTGPEVTLYFRQQQVSVWPYKTSLLNYKYCWISVASMVAGVWTRV